MQSKPHFRTAASEGWTPAEYPRAALRDALVEAGIAGVNSHDRANVLWKIRRLEYGDPDLQFGISGASGIPTVDVLALVAEAAGFAPDPGLREGPVEIDPESVLAGCERIGARLAEAAERGERLILATGHPAALPLLYQETAGLVVAAGAKLLRPFDGVTWKELGRHRQIRYLGGVAVLTDRAGTKHTHSPDPMRRMLEEQTPDLVFADHGFAGAAIEAGIDTVSIADVNDPALVVAHDQGRAGPVVVMDDGRQPESYWPCFQAIASRFDE
ncbi:MAG: phosphatase [Actinomycetota bacterium]